MRFPLRSSSWETCSDRGSVSAWLGALGKLLPASGTGTGEGGNTIWLSLG